MSKTDGGSILLFTDRDSVDIMELKERVYHAEQEEKTEKEKNERQTCKLAKLAASPHTLKNKTTI